MKNKVTLFSKPSLNHLKLKQDFFNSNNSLLKDIIKTNRKLSKQKKRLCCKVCGAKLGKKIFKSHLIEYTECTKCGHLNSLNEDTVTFSNYLYNSNKGKNYSNNYLKVYDLRVKNIYVPKVKFLINVMNKQNVKKYSVTDVGSGAGHFLKALEQKKIQGIGYEPSQTLVTVGKKKLKMNEINNTKMSDFAKIILNAKTNVISMIGVLEHLNDPDLALRSFQKSKAKYLYILIPHLSFSTLLENANQSVFPRSLGGGHTHLYSNKSINYMAKKYKLSIIGEWWFGTDMMDLYRHLLVLCDQSKKMKLLIKKIFENQIDDLQKIMDTNKLCSEVHLIFKKK